MTYFRSKSFLPVYESMSSRQTLTERKLLMFDAGIARSVTDESEFMKTFNYSQCLTRRLAIWSSSLWRRINQQRKKLLMFNHQQHEALRNVRVKVINV